MLITQSELKSIVHYSPNTGLFHRYMKKESRPPGNVNSHGYLRLFIRGHGILYCHRLAFLYVTGDIPQEVDHINGVRDDNKWNNLRASNHTINARNTSLSRRNKSGFSGVIYDKERNKWRAQIGNKYGKSFIGRYETKEEAIVARKAKEKELGFHENHGRENKRYFNH